MVQVAPSGRLAVTGQYEDTPSQYVGAEHGLVGSAARQMVVVDWPAHTAAQPLFEPIALQASVTTHALELT